jgi:hypothetical protein
LQFEFSYKDLFRSIYAWRKKNSSILSVTLTGIGKPSFSPSAIAPKYQFKVYTNHTDFLERSDWINELGEYLVCFYDAYCVRKVEIESRVVVFHPDVIVEFLFEPLHLLPASPAEPGEIPFNTGTAAPNPLFSMLQNYN